MSANDNSSKSLTVAIAAVATLLILVIGVAVGLSLRTDTAPKEQAMPSSTPATTSSSPTSKTTTTTTSTTSTKPSPSPTSSRKSSATSSSTATTTTTSTSAAPKGQDFGTGRDDLDGLGFVGSAARCDSGDRAFAVIATAEGTKAAACETRSGDKYYRSDAPSGRLSTGIIVDEGDRIVARNGSFKYQMSPEGLLVTKDNNPIEKQAATAWGTA
nr:hypothetical protein [Corynebacterium lactis]